MILLITRNAWIVAYIRLKSKYISCDLLRYSNIIDQITSKLKLWLFLSGNNFYFAITTFLFHHGLMTFGLRTNICLNVRMSLLLYKVCRPFSLIVSFIVVSCESSICAISSGDAFKFSINHFLVLQQPGFSLFLIRPFHIPLVLILSLSCPKFNTFLNSQDDSILLFKDTAILSCVKCETNKNYKRKNLLTTTAYLNGRLF